MWLEAAKGISCPLAEVPSRADDLRTILEAGGNWLLEDAKAEQIDETVLFHLLNFVRETGRFCLITSRTWPLEWDIKLPDLLSRLRAAQVIELYEPDDYLLKQVIVKLFADRQIMIDEKIVEYCTLRMERSLDTASRLVAAIDAEALARKVPISRTIAAKVLEEMGMT